MSQKTLLTLPRDIRLMIYKAVGVKPHTLELVRGLRDIVLDGVILDGVGEVYYDFPTQLLSICRAISNETVPLLYSNLRIWSLDLQIASNFLRTVGPANAKLIRDLRVLVTSSHCPLLETSRWFEQNSDVLHHLNVIQIEYLFTTRRDFDSPRPMAFLQRMTNTLFDSPLWASHRMRCKGFEKTGPDRRKESFLVMVVRG